MAWWLADAVLNETMEKDYPITDDATFVTEYPDLKKGEGIYYGDNYGYEYTPVDSGEPFNQDFLADNDDQAAHHFNLNNEVQEKETMANYFKYHEEEILRDIEEYVSATYRGHYTGDTHEYRNVQTIDLMAARSLASGFCQSNILKYGSRYGSKDGRNKKDLLKVIHYAMLLLHFDDHYGKPSITSGNIDHNMP
jgi:hypothetical protein